MLDRIDSKSHIAVKLWPFIFIVPGLIPAGRMARLDDGLSDGLSNKSRILR
jgi:hypothetical protein